MPEASSESDVVPVLLGESRLIERSMELLRRAAPTSTTVLVRGETGTGKGVAARFLHESSLRRNAPFVKIDCSAIPQNLLESELFGYERGAFTGATTQKVGRVELANGGTLFLDEIGEIPLALQPKLLRFIQDREFERLGSTRTISADTRIVAATHRNLEGMVTAGEFREDLLYRLKVVTIWLPPLRARRGDVDVLARHFCELVALDAARQSLGIDADALRILRAQRWPGNVRELRNLIERLAILTEGPTIDESHVRAALASDGGEAFATEPVTSAANANVGASVAASSTPRIRTDLDDKIRTAERVALLQALEAARGNRTRAAQMLGISRSTLYLKLAEYEIP